MLKPPYTKYDWLYVYHLDLDKIPQVNDQDLIGVWMEDQTAVLFFHRPKEKLVAQLCQTYKCSIIYQADLAYRDWEAGQLISSFTVDDMTVAPVWEKGPADIRLDPSVIFGSGFHPTTRVCLDALLKYLKTPEIEINSVLDLGTGTGLLSIAAALCGAENVIAVDNNPLACEVASSNCKINKVEDRVTVHQMDLRSNLPSTEGCNMLIANLYRGLLEQLFKTPSFWKADFYILSGFIHSMEPELLAEIPTEKLRFLERRRSDKWCIWVLANKDTYNRIK